MLLRPCRSSALSRTGCLTSQTSRLSTFIHSVGPARYFSDQSTNTSTVNNDASSDPSYVRRVPIRTPDQLKESLRRYMRTVPYPVAIVTTSHQQSNANPRSSTYAATVSSFNTVSFDPVPFVSFNLAADSITQTTIAKTNHFAVTILQDAPTAARFANRFTKGNSPSPFLEDDRTVGHDRIHFDDWEWAFKGAAQIHRPQNLKQLPPGLQVKGATAFSILCRKTHSVAVGDHVLVVGRVLRIADYSSARRNNHEYGKEPNIHLFHTCLSYAHGSYSTNPDGTTFGALWKPEDPFLHVDYSPLNSRTRNKALHWYNKRLGLIQLELQKLSSTEKRPLSASKFNMNKLARMEEYYQKRLLELQGKVVGSSPDPELPGTDPADPSPEDYVEEGRDQSTSLSQASEEKTTVCE